MNRLTAELRAQAKQYARPEKRVSVSLEDIGYAG
jgi:histone H3/H4